VGFFWGGFFRWVYPKKPTGFFWYVPGCLNPGSNSSRGSGSTQNCKVDGLYITAAWKNMQADSLKSWSLGSYWAQKFNFLS